MTTTSINLKHGEVNVNIQVEGVNPIDMKSVFEEAFAVFMKEIAPVEKVEDKIEKAYLEVYSKSVERNESDVTDAVEQKIEETTCCDEQGEAHIAESTKTMEELLKDVDSRNYRNFNGVYRFQVFYICEKCRHKGKAFVEQRPTFKCRECGYTMKLIPATDRPFPFHDEFGNFYVAGKFKRTSEHAKSIEQSESVDNVYQFKLEQEMVESDGSNRSPKLMIK